VEQLNGQLPLDLGADDHCLLVGHLIVVDFFELGGPDETVRHMVDDAVSDEVLVQVAGLVG